MSDLHRAVEAELDAHRPSNTPPFSAARARKRARKQRRAGSAVALSVVAVLGVAFPSALGSSWSSVLGQAAAPQPSPSQALGSDAPQAGAPVRVASPSASADTRTGPVGEGSSFTRCIEQYSRTTLKKRAFAFDGTITSIGPVATNKYDDGHRDTASVTFTVNEWFIGVTAQRSSLI